MELNCQNNEYLVEELTQNYMTVISNHKNESFIKIYSEFSFYYCNCSSFNNQEIKDFIIKLLQENKFVTYEISQIDISNNKAFFPLKRAKILENKQLNSVNIVICIEKCCYIFESIDKNLLNSILSTKNVFFININKNQNINNLLIDHSNQVASNEVNNFCSYYLNLIETNFCIDLTIRPIMCYLIRRFYYPSYFFKDTSFFYFNDHQQKEKKLLMHLNSLCQSKNSENLDQYEDNITSEITKEMKEQSQIKEFQKGEFKKLRQIYSNNNFCIYLVIHLPTLYIFAMKKTKTPNYNEIEFCSNYSHRCFTHFYGFYKRKCKTCFIYEFMSQGNLLDYILNCENKPNTFFSFNAIIRIYQGIKYLQSKNLIHRDLNPTNILIDHDNNIFISDFETIRKVNTNSDSNYKEYTQNIGTMIYSALEQNSGENISFPVDIYSFGQIMYFIFERKNPFDSLSPVIILKIKWLNLYH